MCGVMKCLWGIGQEGACQTYCQRGDGLDMYSGYNVNNTKALLSGGMKSMNFDCWVEAVASKNMRYVIANTLGTYISWFKMAQVVCCAMNSSDSWDVESKSTYSVKAWARCVGREDARVPVGVKHKCVWHPSLASVSVWRVRYGWGLLGPYS